VLEYCRCSSRRRASWSGEIGYDDQTGPRTVLPGRLALARDATCRLQVHTRIATRSAGTAAAAWTWRRDGTRSGCVVIDHNNEGPSPSARPRLLGAFTLYRRPDGNEDVRSAALRLDARVHPLERRLGQVRPRRGAEDGRLMLERGIREDVEAICYGNALAPSQAANAGVRLLEPQPSTSATSSRAIRAAGPGAAGWTGCP